ncbi:MAG: FxsA family protein [Spirochaetales bacterium]
MFGKLLLLFTVVPLIELYLLILIGQAIGAGPTVLIVLLTGAVGASLARMQGFSVWVKINREMNVGRFPGNELIDAVLVLAAGVTLLTPGVVTDVVGFLLLIPITRAPIREFIKRRFRRMNLSTAADVHSQTIHADYKVESHPDD